MAAHSLPPLRPGDVVAVLMPPGPEWITVVRHAWEAGAALLPVDSRLGAGQVGRLLERARPAVVVAGDGVRRLGGEPASTGAGAVVPTSGSTGDPRLVELSREAITAAVATSADAIGARPSDPWLSCLPLAHIGGLLVVFRHVLLGAPLVVHRSFDVDAFCAATDTRFTSIVPTQLHRLLERGCDLLHLRALLVGGAALPQRLAAAAAAAGVRAISTYGLTESCGGVVYDGVPLPGTEVRVTGDGEVQLRGPTLMQGYRFDAAASATAFTEDGWLRTRDAGEVTAGGVLRVDGRLDDVIVSGGEKIWPLEVEAVLAMHPLVAEVAIGKRPDPEWGDRAVAYVVPRRRDDPPSLESLRDFASERLARYKAPREVRIVEQLDRTALGKVRRDRLGG